MVFFKTAEFEFEARRLMWYCPYGGSDFAEVSATCDRISDGDYESWYDNWHKTAEQLVQMAKTVSSKCSAGGLYLRASRYYQAAEFFLPPADKRKIVAFNHSVNYFYDGLDQLAIPYKLATVNYQNSPLRTVFFPTEKDCKGTMFVCGGFDALMEELYFTSVCPALAEGYQVIIFEAPGQSASLRRYQTSFDTEFHEVCATIVQYWEEVTVKPLIGVGLSLGGLFMARAQAKQPSLFDALVLYNYFPNLLESFKQNIPSFLHSFLYKGFPPILERMVSCFISKQPFINWQVEQAKWTFGKMKLNELLWRCQEFEELSLTSLTLVFLAENDNYYDYRLGLSYFNEKVAHDNKRLVLFSKDQYFTDLHCQNGAAFASQIELFEWLAELFSKNILTQS